MSEVYPSDSELLNLLSESETGVEYIPTGTAPYYVHFRKLLYRLLLATKRANDFRLYDEGGLTYGVKPGKFWDGNTCIEYAGSSGNIMPDNDTKYIYLDKTGAVRFVEYEMWFDMFNAEVRLAEVTTLNGDITSIVDARDQHSTSIPYIDRPSVFDHIIEDQLAHSQSGSVHTNKGATGSLRTLLPSFNAAGTKYTFVVAEAFDYRIYPTGNKILSEAGAVTNKSLVSNTIGDCLTVVMNEDGNWYVTARYGTWTKEV
jgi:hypothetical protein